jgi:roadblock/LC7 domain-containing protein
MRQAVRTKPARPATGSFVSLPAPTKGLNFRDSVAALKSDEALILDNYFPEQSYVRLRRGFAPHVTGFGSPVETLMEYASPSSRKLFAAAGTAIYDATSAGAVGAGVVTSLTNARWQHLMFTTAAGDYLVCVNGADGVRTYNGATWATETITGATAANFVGVASWKGRLWFWENGSSKAWYLASGAKAGAVNAIQTGDVFRLGGSIALIAPLSFNSGNIVDDGIVFISTEGECALYIGTDPASSTTFALQGVFRIPAPLGTRRGHTRFNGDVLVMTEGGLVSLLQATRLDVTQRTFTSVSDNIDSVLKEQARDERSTYGWQVFSYPAGGMLWVNAPQSATEFHQWTMNSITAAWCRFKNMDAVCWGLLSNAPYFGGQTAVYRADYGASDNSANIEGEVKSAFSTARLGQPKRVTMLRPFIKSSGRLRPRVGVDLDFSDATPTNFGAALSVGGLVWGTGRWGVDVWGGSEYTSREWVGVEGIGTWIAPRMKTASMGAEIKLNAWDMVFEPAGLNAL